MLCPTPSVFLKRLLPPCRTALQVLATSTAEPTWNAPTAPVAAITALNVALISLLVGHGNCSDCGSWTIHVLALRLGILLPRCKEIPRPQSTCLLQVLLSSLCDLHVRRLLRSLHVDQRDLLLRLLSGYLFLR